MTHILIMFGILMLLIGIVAIVNPDYIFRLLTNNSDKFWLHTTAVLVRLLFGILFIHQAAESNYPRTIEVLGWVFIAAAIILTLIGRNKFQRLITWATSLMKSFGRIAGVLVISFGVFVIYAFI